jgi:NTP pyrophosphatase (non-canonical NTP hydrolase)
MNGERLNAPSMVPPISAKQIRWTPDGDSAWTGSMGFHIEFDAEEPPESRFTASWGEGDSEVFPTIDEARAWCQAMADGWIREFGEVSAPRFIAVVGHTLTFEAFRRANVARCEKWHPAGIGSWSPSDWLTAVTGELGELASLLKMRNRERDGLPGNKFSPTEKQIADELADVLTYLDLLAAVLGVDLGRAAVEKFNDVSERVGFPDRISLAATETGRQ